MRPELSQLATAQQIAAAELRDPEVLREHERTALAHIVALRLIRYRTDHGLSQTALARQLGMHQPAIARLEAGGPRTLSDHPRPARPRHRHRLQYRDHPARLRVPRHSLSVRTR